MVLRHQKRRTYCEERKVGVGNAMLNELSEFCLVSTAQSCSCDGTVEPFAGAYDRIPCVIDINLQHLDEISMFGFNAMLAAVVPFVVHKVELGGIHLWRATCTAFTNTVR